VTQTLVTSYNLINTNALSTGICFLMSRTFSQQAVSYNIKHIHSSKCLPMSFSWLCHSVESAVKIKGVSSICTQRSLSLSKLLCA